MLTLRMEFLFIVIPHTIKAYILRWKIIKKRNHLQNSFEKQRLEKIAHAQSIEFE